jgi:hypothetical protein
VCSKDTEVQSCYPQFGLEIAGYESFIKNNAQLIDQKRRILWPKLSRVDHWSGLKMVGRVALLKHPFTEIYETSYPQLSWFVHSGLTGVLNLKAETFIYISANAFQLAAQAYEEILRVMIREFKMNKADTQIEKKMEYAKKVSFTDSPEQAQELLNALLS